MSPSQPARLSSEKPLSLPRGSAPPAPLENGYCCVLGVWGHGSWGRRRWGTGCLVGIWAGLNGRGCPFPSSILERSLKTKGNRIGRGYKIRVGCHLMPENSSDTSPSTAKCWYCMGSKDESESEHPPSRKEIISATPGTSLSIYLFSVPRISNSNLCDLGEGYCQ